MPRSARLCSLQNILPALLSASVNYAGQATKTKTKISVCKQVHVNASRNSEQMKGTKMKGMNATLWHAATQAFLCGHASTSRHLPPSTNTQLAVINRTRQHCNSIHPNKKKSRHRHLHDCKGAFTAMCVSRSGMLSIAPYCTEHKIVLPKYPENDSS